MDEFERTRLKRDAEHCPICGQRYEFQLKWISKEPMTEADMSLDGFVKAEKLDEMLKKRDRSGKPCWKLVKCRHKKP